MKYEMIPLVFLLALFPFQVNAQDLANEHSRENAEIAPNRNLQPSVSGSASENYFELLWAVPVGVGGGEAGIESDGNYIYTTKWNGDEFYRYDMDGDYIESFFCGEASQIRDLAWDGTYFYGGAAGTTVYEMDFDNQVVVSTFTSPVAVRAIAYDDYHDGFYANNWSTEITLFNRSGVVLNSFSPWYYENYYGFAYDNVNGYGPFLWGFSQDGSGGVAVQMELPSGYETGFTYDIVAELGGPGDLAGGCAFLILGSDYVFLGMVQNSVICAYSLFSYPTDHDMGIQQIVQPSSGQNLGMEPITISIKNYGYFPEAGIPWEVFWNDTSYSGVWPDTLFPGFNAEITLPVTADLSEPGEYIFEACTYLEGDQNPDNDCKTKVVEHQMPGYCIDFLYSSGCNLGDGLISWQLANIDIPEIPCSGTPEWYHDYSDSIHHLVPGEYELTVEAGYTNTYFDFWINYNDDFEFTDDELLIDDGLCEAANTSYSFIITIPDTVPSGEFRMRYRTNWAAPVTDPCETYSYGNCCDFSVSTYVLPPPQNLQVSVTGNDVSMEWDEPEPTASKLLGYQVYLDGEIVSDTVAETSWDIAGCPDGSHWVSVSAVYDDGESEMAEPVHVEIGALAGKLQGFIRDAVTKLNVPSAWISASDAEYGAVSYATPFGSHYSLHLPGGTYTVICSADGYDPVTYNNVAIPNGATRALNFYLNPEGSDKEMSAAAFKAGNAEQHAGEFIRIHPNPAKETVTLSSNANILSVNMLDLNGQLLQQINTSGKEIHLNISKFEPGIYVLEIETENGINMQKFVIQ